MSTTPLDTPVDAPPGSPGGDAAATLPVAKPPVGTGASPLVAQLLALALIGLGVTGIQALLVSLGAVSGPSWIEATVDAADGIEGSSVVVLVVGIVAVLVGLVLLLVALKPRPRRGITLAAAPSVHLRPRDVARVVESLLDDVEAVSEVRVRARRRRLRVTATTVLDKSHGTGLRDAVRSRLAPLLTALEHEPRLKVHLHHDDA